MLHKRSSENEKVLQTWSVFSMYVVTMTVNTFSALTAIVKRTRFDPDLCRAAAAKLSHFLLHSLSV